MFVGVCFIGRFQVSGRILVMGLALKEVQGNISSEAEEPRVGAGTACRNGGRPGPGPFEVEFVNEEGDGGFVEALTVAVPLVCLFPGVEVHGARGRHAVA